MATFSGILAAIIFPLGAAAFLLIALLLPLTFPDREPWRFLLVWTSVGLSVFSLMLAMSVSPYAIYEYADMRLYIRLAYAASLACLIPYSYVYFRGKLQIRFTAWVKEVRDWIEGKMRVQGGETKNSLRRGV